MEGFRLGRSTKGLERISGALPAPASDPDCPEAAGSDQGASGQRSSRMTAQTVMPGERHFAAIAESDPLARYIRVPRLNVQPHGRASLDIAAQPGSSQALRPYDRLSQL